MASRGVSGARVMKTPTPRRTQRRPLSCEPCRKSKEKCLGGDPCATCLRKRKQPKCVYRKDRSKEGADAKTQSIPPDQEDQTEAEESMSQHETPDISIKAEESMSEDENPDVDFTSDPPRPQTGLDGEFCLALCVDELKTILPNDGDAGYVSEIFPTSYFLHASVEHPENIKSDVDVTSPEVLDQTMGPRSFLCPGPGSNLSVLRHLNMRYLGVRQLLETGSILQAWLVLPTLFREVTLAGLISEGQRREPHNIELGRRYWWLLVLLDAQLSLLLGRKPITSSEIDVPRPSMANVGSQQKSIFRSLFDYSSLVLEALGHFNPDRTGPDEASSETRKRMLEVFLTRLQEIKLQLPHHCAQHFTDIHVGIVAADHELEVQVFEAILHYRIARLVMEPSSSTSASDNETAALGGERQDLPQQPTLEHPLAKFLQTVRKVIDHFEYMCCRYGSDATNLWSRCHSLYCAAIALAMCPRQVADTGADAARLGKVIAIFRTLPSDSPADMMAAWAFCKFNRSLVRLSLAAGLSPNEDGTFASKYSWDPVPGEMLAKARFDSLGMYSNFCVPAAWLETNYDGHVPRPMPPPYPYPYPYEPSVTSSPDANDQMGSVGGAEYHPTDSMYTAYPAGLCDCLQSGSPVPRCQSPTFCGFCHCSETPGTPETPLEFIPHEPSTQGVSEYNLTYYDPSTHGLPVYNNTMSMQEPWWLGNHEEDDDVSMDDVPMQLPPSPPQTPVQGHLAWQA